MSQAYFEEGSEAMLALESMVDKVGLRNVIYALAQIAADKAEHLAHAWQDHEAAASWERHARRLDAVATHIVGPGV